MNKRSVEFKSEGVTIRGDFYVPDKKKGPFPCLVMAGGWCYVKEIVIPHYAKYYIDQGIACLLIDYRFFGGSDGEPRQHLDPWKQIEDYKSGVSYAETLPEVDPERIGVWGISYSGGHVFIVGATDPRVKLIIGMVPVIDGYEMLKRAHGTMAYRDLMKAIIDDRRKRFLNPDDRGHIPMSAVDHWKTLSSLPWPEVYEVFTKIQQTEAPLHKHWNTIESVELCLMYTIKPYLPRIVDTPSMMILGEGDDFTQWDQEVMAFHDIGTQKKELFIVPKTSHMTLYSNLTSLELAGKKGAAFAAKYLVEPFSKK